MNLRRFILLAFIASILAVEPLRGADKPFSVTIVSNREGPVRHDGKLAADLQPLPIITIPMHPKSPDGVGLDERSGYSFYVVIRNESQELLSLNYWDSDWYECLSFQMITPSGKTFNVHRPFGGGRFGNGRDPWTAKPGDMRVLLIDFTTGRWTGFPSGADFPGYEPYKIKAIFKYYDKKQKSEPIEFESPTIDANA